MCCSVFVSGGVDDGSAPTCENQKDRVLYHQIPGFSLAMWNKSFRGKNLALVRYKMKHGAMR